MKTFKLHCIRHGITQANLDGTYAGGGLDVPLCAQGVEELQNLQQKYTYPVVPVVFSSPMQRALQTAELLFPHVAEKIVVEDLRENIFGEFEGRKVEELLGDERFAQWLNPESGFVPEGGESGKAFAARTANALYAIMEYMIKNEIPEAACVTHGGVIMSMLSQKGLPQQPPKNWMVKNGCGFTVQTSAAMLMRDGSVELVQTLPNSR
ncbi:histidine phosphatase family protein [Ruminococcaceae bacterium OttesenSCG-928-A16]|nr:histidine phosphatase family protein [Ruminococcaceae bacterium OttesenSCG-928-A16]